MAVKGKGKAVAAAAPPGGGSTSAGGTKRRKGSADAGPSSSAAAEAAKRRRRSGVLQFFDDAAYVGDDDEEEEEEEEMFESEEEDIDDGFFAEGKAENVNLKRTERSHPLPFLGIVKEEELSGDELEEFIKERYSSRVKHTAFDGSTNVDDDEFTMDGLLKEPTIWRIKCMVGRERQMAFCLMQKYVDLQKFGTKVPIISAFALDHVRGFVFVEAEKACDVTEACKGFCSVYISRINAVPAAEVPSLLSSRAKPFVISPGTWVRVKSGNYKEDLAQVVNADEGRKRVMIKLIPRVDLWAISKKFGGGISLKETAIPAPRLISSQELEFFRPHIEMKRDRQTGDVFEVLDGLMFKDGFLYKRVALSSLIYWGIQPTETELLKFSSSPTNTSSTDDLDWVSSIYGPKKRNLPKKQDMPSSSSKASSSKGKCSKASNLKASTSTEDYEDDGYNLHDLVLFGRKDFGVVIAFEKDGLRILKGGPEGFAMTVKKQDIKKVCADQMFTAVDHKKKIISINDTVNVLEGPFQGKQGVVKHLYMGILFIYNESEGENNGYFCAQCGACENVKKRKELASSTFGNSEDNPIPMFSYEQNEQRDNERPYRSTREQLFSIGEMLRIRKGPLKGYLCRVVRIFRNDVTVKLDSLLKIVTVQAEFLSVPAKRGDNSSGAPSGPFGNQDKPFFGSEAEKPSWDNGLPSFGSDSWQPFSSSALPVQNADGESDVDPWSKKTASSADNSDPWGMKTKSASVEVWNNSATQKENSSDDAWGKQPGGSGSNIGGSSWDRMTADKESGKSDNWGDAYKETDKTGSDPDPWGSKVKEVDLKETDNWGKASMETEKKSEDDSHGWGQPVGKSNQDQGKGAEKSGAWDTVIAESSLSVPGKGDDYSWAKTDSSPVAQDDAWGKSKDDSNDGADGWNETKTSNQSHGTGGWDTAAGNWNNSSDVDGHKDAWGKAKDATANSEEKNNEGETWNKARALDQVGGSDWGNPKFSSGDGPSSWNKGDEVGGDSQNGNWSRPSGNFEGGRGFGQGRGRGRGRESGDLGGRNGQGSWKNSGGSDSTGRPSWRSDSQVDKEAGDSGEYQGRGRGRGQYGGQGRGDNGWRNGGRSSSEFGRCDADAPNWGNKQPNFADGGSADRDKGASNKGSWDSGDNWNAPNSSINQPWSSSRGTKSPDENQASTWNSSEDKKPSGGQDQQSDAWASKMTSTAGVEDKSDGWGTKAEGNSGSTGGKWENASSGEERESDPWGSKICSTKGKEQETDPWTSKVTSTADADDNNNGWNARARDTSSGSEGKWGNAGIEEKVDAWKSKEGNENTGGWNSAGSSWGNQKSSWGKPTFSGGEQEPAWSNPKSGDDNSGYGRGGFGCGNRGRGRGRNFGDSRSSWTGGSNRNDESRGERSEDRWNTRDSDGGRGRGRFGRGDRTQGNSYGSGGNNDRSWGSGRGNSDRNDGRRPFGQDRGGGWNQSSDWNSNKGITEDQAFSKGKSSWGSDKNDSWGAPKPSGGDDQAGKNNGTNPWGAPPSDTTTGGGSGGGGSCENRTADTSEKSSWGGSEAGQKKEGSWEKSEGSGSQAGGGSSWDKPDGGWNSSKGKDTQGGGGGSAWDKTDGGWNSSSKGGSSGNGGW